jgi:hypothetical protein
MADVLAAPDAARLTDFARAFKAAARAVVLYPDGHPATASTLARLGEVTSPPLLTAPLRLSIAGDTLLIDGAAPARADTAVVELAGLLHAHLIGELTVRASCTKAEWRSFLQLLGRAPDAVRTDGGIARLWPSTRDSHIEVREIDYAEVLRERSGGRAASWQQLIASCLAGDTFELPEDLLQALLDGTADSTVLAEVIRALDAAVAQAGIGAPDKATALIRFVRGIVAAVRARSPERVDAVMRELAVALGTVSPDTLLAMLVERREDEEGRTVVRAVVSRMPDATIASFVARHATDAGTPIDRLAQAFQALVVDSERRERLVSMAHEAAVASGASEAVEPSWESIAERLLAEYTDAPFVSERYAQQLTTIRGQAATLESTSDDPPERIARWLDTVATGELRRLDLLLVLDLLRLERNPEQRAALVSPVVSLLDDYFLVGDFEAAQQVLAALRDNDGLGSDPLVAGALVQLLTPSTLRTIIGHVATVDDAQFPRLKAVFAALGESPVPALAEALSLEERSRTRERLTEILVGFGAAGRTEVERLKTSANPAVRRTAIYLLREFGGSDALPDLAELLDDAEPAVQREAVRAILNLGTDAGYRVLEQALVTGTPQSREAIMQALGSSRDERAAPLLVYILDHVPHDGDLAWVYARALDLLGPLSDPRAIPALQRALYRGSWLTPRRTARLRRAAAGALLRLGPGEASAILQEAAQRGSWGVRAAARAQLATCRADRARGRD